MKLTRSEVVRRARAAIGRGTIYKLGAGGRLKNPGIGAELDCSGFVAVVLGVDRYLEPWLPHYEGGDWLETSALVRDAQSPWGFVTEVPWTEARPGDLLAWGDHGHGQGHVGIVATINGVGPATVVHCSAGNYRGTSDAIRETGSYLFAKNAAIVARVAWVTDDQEAAA